MEKDVYTVTGEDGIVYYLDKKDEKGFAKYGSVECVDIDIPDDVKVVNLELPETEKKSAIFSFAELTKSFPNVKSLVIGSRVTSIEIRNSLFPNVRDVVSYNSSYDSGHYLVWFDTDGGRMLENSFCLREDEFLDLEGIDGIEDGALYGCMTTDIRNADKIKLVVHGAFEGSAVYNKKPPKNGCVSCGQFLLHVDEEADRLEIPKNVCRAYGRIKVSGIKEIVFNNLEIVSRLRSLPEKVTFTREVEEMEKIFSSRNWHTVKEYCVDPENPYYKSVDGTLLDKEGKILIKYPDVEGEAVIPEGITEISKYAFYINNASKITLPNSLTKICQFAFFHCHSLENIDFGHGIKDIGGSETTGSYPIIEDCAKLEHLVIPKQVKNIFGMAFFRSNVKSVELPEGLEFIGKSAFQDCEIDSLTLPSTMRALGIKCLNAVKHVTVLGDMLPNRFIRGISQTNNLWNAVIDDDIKYISSNGVEITHNGESVYMQRPVNPDTAVTTIGGLRKCEHESAEGFLMGILKDGMYDDLLKILKVNGYFYDEARLIEMLDIADRYDDAIAKSYILEEIKKRNESGEKRLTL